MTLWGSETLDDLNHVQGLSKVRFCALSCLVTWLTVLPQEITWSLVHLSIVSESLDTGLPNR